MQGLVVKNTGSWYQVLADNNSLVACKIKGNFRLKEICTTNPVAVGDRVVIDINEDQTGIITQIEPRRNYMIRRSSNLSKQAHIIASNLDQVLLLVTIAYPETTTTFIDRFLSTAEAYKIPAIVVFNKCDRYGAAQLEELDSLERLYNHIGYPCFRISALHHQGFDKLHEVLSGKVTLLSGHSGVGKSTLINGLLPGSDCKTADISTAHHKGMHTTTFSSMLPLKQGGYLIDTPGIKGFGTLEMEKEMVSHYFPDIFSFAQACKFSNCLHIHEPGCAVLNAVQSQHIALCRYNSYLSILTDDQEQKYR